jgi:hypothetical protein
MTAVNYQQMMTGGSQKKKKKQPFNPYAGGSSTPAKQPQTYGGNKAVNQAPGVGGNTADPLTAAIAGGATGGGLGANNPYASGTSTPGAPVTPEVENPYAGGTSTPGAPPPPPPPPANPYASGTSTPGAPVTTAPPEVVNPYASGTSTPGAPVATTSPDVINPYASGTSTPGAPVTPEVVNPYAGGTSTPGAPVTPDRPEVVNPYASGTSTPGAPVTPEVVNPYASGTSTPGAPVTPEVINPYASGTSTPGAPVTTPTMTADEYAAVSKGGVDPITEAMTADEYAALSRGEAPAKTSMTPDEYSQILAGGAPGETTPSDIAGAGADMAAAQNVVTPEAAPMADTLEGALRQQYMSRVGGTDDPILASQLADQQMRQNEARKALVEQLGRYGVLRGGGDTAAALARMGEGDERNRLALEAQAAQRRQQDLRDAQGFDLGQRGMGIQEDRAQQDILTQALNRDIARAGQTGIFERDKTMAAKRQSAELDALRRGQERADAALTGEFGEDGQQTLAGKQLESQLFGKIGDRQTLTGETTQSGLDTQDLQRRIAEAGQTGRFDFGDQRGTTQTQQAKALGSELDTAALSRAATRAGVTGQFIEEDAADDALPVDTLEKTLREAGLTGMLGDDPTLAGRQADMELIGAILAGQELRNKPGTPELLEGLTQNIKSFDPESIELIKNALRTTTDFKNPPGDDNDDGYRNPYEVAAGLQNVGAGGGTGGVVNVVEGEVTGTRGNLGDEENEERLSVNRFLENNPDLGSGQLRIFVKKDGTRQLINVGSGQAVATYNADTGEFERT